MKIIPVRVEDMAQGPWVVYDEGDLVWVSQIQTPFGEDSWLRPVKGCFLIPCDLGIVRKIHRHHEHVWAIEVEFGCSDVPVGVYVDDVMMNLTKLRKIEKEFNSARRIQRAYRVHHGIRKLMAKRIQRAYIRHYFHPRNPNMVKRMLDGYMLLTEDSKQLSSKRARCW